MNSTTRIAVMQRPQTARAWRAPPARSPKASPGGRALMSHVGASKDRQLQALLMRALQKGEEYKVHFPFSPVLLGCGESCSTGGTRRRWQARSVALTCTSSSALVKRGSRHSSVHFSLPMPSSSTCPTPRRAHGIWRAPASLRGYVAPCPGAENLGSCSWTKSRQSRRSSMRSSTCTMVTRDAGDSSPVGARLGSCAAPERTCSLAGAFCTASCLLHSPSDRPLTCRLQARARRCPCRGLRGTHRAGRSRRRTCPRASHMASCPASSLRRNQTERIC